MVVDQRSLNDYFNPDIQQSRHVFADGVEYANSALFQRFQYVVAIGPLDPGPRPVSNLHSLLIILIVVQSVKGLGLSKKVRELTTHSLRSLAGRIGKESHPG